MSLPRDWMMPFTLACLLLLQPACTLTGTSLGGGGGGGVDGGTDGVDGGGITVLQGDLTNVTAVMHADNARISFDPVDDAKDYRVYLAPLLPDGGVDVNALPGADGGTAMPGALYRCGGDREAPRVANDSEPLAQGESAHTTVNGSVSGYTRSTADATVGYVYVEAASDRVPVYALGDPSSSGDNSCASQRWDETRIKKYVTTDIERQTLIGQGWRDYGAVFYVPPAAGSGTVQISTALLSGNRLYFGPGAELTARGSQASPAFLALAASAAGTAPLMRVHYQMCGKEHDELVVGNARFQRAAHQGNTPVTELEWTGIQGPTQLVIEALDQGCPFQGFLSPVSFPSVNGHQPFFTIADLRAADANHEVFVNGQHAGVSPPRPMRRSILQVTPQAHDTSFDFLDSFDTDPGPYNEVPYSSDYSSKRFQTAKYDFTFYRIDYSPLALGTMLKEFWVAWADGGADLEAKFRMTANQKATMPADGTFLHVKTEVDVVSTDRRYPQILISDQNAPVQDNLPNGSTILVQTFGVWPNRLDIQFCDHRTWGVTNQCPRYVTDFPDLASVGANNPPSPVVGELAAVDRRVRWDVYASTDHVYAMLDGEPVACAILPAGRMPSGPVTVTFGDVLYHSGVDVPDPPYTFHQDHMHLETRRHLDEFGFKSGLAAPAWNPAVPCTSVTK